VRSRWSLLLGDANRSGGSAPAFEEHPQVLNGCSDLMVAVFGPKGVHARSVFGATSVRANLPIIIDSIFEVER
jgi:hypothetical protein